MSTGNEAADLLGRLAEVEARLNALRPSAPFLSLSAVARELRLSKAKVVRLVREKKLRSVDTGGRHPRFTRADVEGIKADGFNKASVRRAKAPDVFSPWPAPEPLESMRARLKVMREEERQEARAERAATADGKPSSLGLQSPSTTR
jgi:excisionase family DNA binding protein